METITPQIIELEEAQAKAFNKGNVGKILDFFYPEIVGFSSTKHDRIAGLEALRETFEFYLKEAEKIDYQIFEPTVQVFGETAVIAFYWQVKLIKGSHTQSIKGRGSHVYAKVDGQWKIVHEHFSRAHHHVEK